MYQNELAHYGVKGMKWGVRRNLDRVVTSDRYRKTLVKAMSNKTINNAAHKLTNYHIKKAKATPAEIKKGTHAANKRVNDIHKSKADLTPEEKAARRKKAIKIGAAVAGTALAAYGTYKLTKAVKEKNFKIMEEAGRKRADEILSLNRTQSMSMLAGKNGTYDVHITNRNGTSGVTTFKTKEAADRYWNHVSELDALTDKRANAAYNSYVTKGSNASLKESAKNVYEYYKRRGR